MSDEEAASLCSIAYQALLMLPEKSVSRRVTGGVIGALVYEIARLRNRTPEDIQNEFEGKGR